MKIFTFYLSFIVHFFINQSIYGERINMNKVYIYGLKNEGIDEYRYIGKTKRPKYRLAEHLHEKKREFSYYKINWVKESIRHNKKIVLEIIEEVNDTTWEERERYYISYYRKQGHRLTNLLEGGGSPQMYKYSLTYDEAKIIARSLNIKTTLEWRIKSKNKELPVNVPKRPDLFYVDNGWNGWSDWLGIEIMVAPKDRMFLNYEESKNFVRQLNLQNNNEWRIYSRSEKRPKNIPSNPDIVYKNRGWISWMDFLGFKKTRLHGIKFLSYNEAKTIVSKIGLKSHREWQVYSKTLRPSNIPANPWKVYDKEWNGIIEFIGC